MADIVINASPAKIFDVELVGFEYKVRAPKMSVLAVVASAAGKKGKKGGDSIKHLDDMVKIMFPQDHEAIAARLADPEDALDYQHVMDLAEQLIEAATGNPTS